MKKHYFTIFICFLMLAVIIVASVHFNINRAQEKPIEGPDALFPELIVDGKKIEDEHVYIVERGGCYVAHMPLVKVLTGLGVPVIWTGGDSAQIEINGNNYILSLKDCTLYREGTTKNCIEKGAGKSNIFGLRVYQDSQDIYFDNYTMESTLDGLGFQIKIGIDIENNKISVTKAAAKGK